MEQAVRVGVGVIIMYKDKILLGERIGAHGANTWATPGGHLEYGETIETCAKREVLEETGLNVVTVENLGFTNDFFAQEQKHYVTLFVKATCDDHHAQVKEPDKCKHWRWFALDALPQPLFLPLTHFLAQHKL
ncbi:MULTISPECIES: NUDIX hydrolase [unclassified Pseudoalteromonas]|uniref:nucleotide triphosphate diphosphatase NUDT15 n=1 Tax=unclassified Pseudoalteromonas TaxID=194690 RepID=UPI000F64C391|nr:MULTISPECIES: NUDIX hydrolase [unclassified Pseudoalteromonas]RRS08481.1 NUDIX domain-containing protein [Pseudoalteromonas sp. J010]RXF04373.1 NUDIX domain-containing protein [Pseudoalteromonas sp. PS5]